MRGNLEGSPWVRCTLCNAEYGHKISCPTWVGVVPGAEARVRLAIDHAPNLSPEARLAAIRAEYESLDRQIDARLRQITGRVPAGFLNLSEADVRLLEEMKISVEGDTR